MVNITKKELLEGNKIIRKLLASGDKVIISKNINDKQRQEVKSRQMKIIKLIKGR